MEAVNIPAQVRATIRRYLWWYAFPLIYFLITGLLCAYAWYTRPVAYRAGIKTVFKTISLNPTLILTGAITAWILIAIIAIPISLWLKRRFPEFSIGSCTGKEDILQNQSSSNKPISSWQKTLNVSLSVLGIILIVAGVSIAGWISRPYITFLFSPSKIEKLEKKAELLGQVQAKQAEEKSDSLKKKTKIPAKVQGDQIKKIEASDTTENIPKQVSTNEMKQTVALKTRAELPEQVGRNETKKAGPLGTISDLFERVRREVKKEAEHNAADDRMRKERLQGKEWKSAEHFGWKNWLIFPNAVVDAPILEGVDENKLAEGVCHISESAEPGQGGNCIIIGHNLGDFFERSGPQGPFNMLEASEKGQLIYIFYKGKKYIYKVKEKTYKDVNDPKLYDFSPGERLTLITCAGTLDPGVSTNTRVVITAYRQ
jgi:LPXTG-site transpeptidase (sortase) family protein